MLSGKGMIRGKDWSETEDLDFCERRQGGRKKWNEIFQYSGILDLQRIKAVPNAPKLIEPPKKTRRVFHKLS